MRPARAVIDLAALRQNYRLARELSDARALAVIKADAYGHGAVAVAKTLASEADGFAVACIEEALELRAAHDGIFMLAISWSGELPRIGEQMWASTEFANLPDIDALEVELRLPQQEAQGLALG